MNKISILKEILVNENCYLSITQITCATNILIWLLCMFITAASKFAKKKSITQGCYTSRARKMHELLKINFTCQNNFT